jgi:hypothetical protein
MYLSQMWWLMSIMSATGKAEIGRIVLLGQPGQKVSETLFQPTSQCGSTHQWSQL